MAELPGWDRSRLLTAPTADVEAARMLVYARVLAPSIVEPLDSHLEALAIEAIESPKRREQKVKSHRRKRRNALLRAKDDQARHRQLLGLDDPDDDPDDEPDADDIDEVGA